MPDRSLHDVLTRISPEWGEAFEPFSLDEGATLFDGGKPIRQVSVITAGMASIRIASGQAASLHGPGSLLGAHGLVPSSVMHLTAQAETRLSGFRAPALAARLISERCVASRRILDASNQALTFRLALTLDLALRHETLPRTAHHLLEIADALGPSFAMTHDRLHQITGIRRASVTTDIQALAKAGAIRQSRGGIDILDRPVLSAMVGPGRKAMEAIADLRPEWVSVPLRGRPRAA